MNKIRRKRIENTIEKLEKIMAEFEDIRDDEQDCFDNLPESLQYSERGETMEEAIDVLDNVLDNINDAIDAARELI